MASFLGLEQIWVWVKKLPILFFAISFISFEPKLKMVVVVASISSTSLFSPYTLVHPKTHNPQPHKPSNSNSKRKQPLRNPSAPPPCANDRLKLLHPTLCRRSDVQPHSDAAPPHTPTSLRCSFTPLSEAIPTSNIFDLSSVKPIYGFGFWFVEEEHDWFGYGFWGAWHVGCDLGFGGGWSEILGCHGGHQRGSWCCGWIWVRGTVGSSSPWVLGLRFMEWLIWV